MRIVVKLGSSSVTRDGRLDQTRITELAGAFRVLSDELVIVSSGAIAAGLSPLGFTQRPKDLPSLQAAASVGQSHLIDSWREALQPKTAAQVLMTRADFAHRSSYLNARATLDRLLALGAVPVLNENDALGTEEIRFGENDLLAALVANLIRADVLVILSDVDGLHTDKGAGGLIRSVETITPEIEAEAGPSGSDTGSGGMISKIVAAKVATMSGVRCVIAKAEPGTVAAIAAGESPGTTFAPSDERMSARKAWIAFAARRAGRIEVDEGARRALVQDKRSLLAAGVKGFSGSFEIGDAVEVCVGDGPAFAAGLVGVSSQDLDRVAGRPSSEVGETLGTPREVIHRDELVIL